MKLLTKEIERKLRANAEATRQAQEAGRDEPDHVPVLKLFNPVGAATWLLTELDLDNPRLVFGLCDLGLGCPELGWASLDEIESLRLPLGLKIERDMHWRGDKTLSLYAEKARGHGRIVA